MINYIINLIKDFIDNYLLFNYIKCPFCNNKILSKRFCYDGLLGLSLYKRINYHCKYDHISYEYNEDISKITRVVYHLDNYIIIHNLDLDFMSVHKQTDLINLDSGKSTLIPDPVKWIKIPIIDLEKYTIDKAISKIKTLIIFS